MTIDGVDIHIEGSGPETIVMVHGWPDTYRLWDAQVPALQDRYRCVRFTLPGFDPAHERRARTVDELSGFLRHVVEQVSPGQPVILMLHDWGCIYGYQFYNRHPRLVSRIVGIDIGDTSSLERELTVVQKLAVLTYQVILAIAWKMGGAAGDGLSRFMARQLGCRTDPARIHSGQTYPYYMTWFGGAQSYRRTMQAFDPACPMLFAYGRRKPVMFHTQGWVDALRVRPGNRVEEFAESGHWIMVTHPDRLNRVVGEWLSAPG